jgi:tetratricopeptide (TPR) repeat protein
MNTVLAPRADSIDCSSAPSRARAWVVVLGAIVALLAIAVFLPVVNNGFVDWDDEKNITENLHFQGWGGPYFRWAWTTFLLGVYQPLGWLLFELEYLGWGLNPRGYHAVSLVLHGMNAALLYALTLTLLKRSDPHTTEAFPRVTAAAAALAVVLFAVHPLRTEPVAWVSSQTYLPCAMFCLLSLLAYLRAVPTSGAPRNAHRGWLAVSLTLFVAALLNKAMAIGLPAVLLALDIYPLRRLGGSPQRWFARGNMAVWLEKLPFFGLSLAFAVVAFIAKQHGSVTEGVATPKASVSLAQLAQSCQAIALYVEKTLVPTAISPYYVALPYVDLGSPAVALSILSVLVVTAVLFSQARRWPALTLAWFSYLALLAPTLGMVRYSAQLAADRYTYLPVMAFHVLLAWGLLRLGSRYAVWRLPWRRGVAALAGTSYIVVVAVLCVYSWILSQIWHDSESLWQWADEHGGRSAADVQNFLGLARLKAGDSNEAMRRFSEAVRLNPNYAEGHHNEATMWGRAGDYVRAEAGFRKTLSINPMHLKARGNLALALQRQGRVNEAIAEYAEALRMNPRNESLHAALIAARTLPGVDPSVAAAATRVLREPSDPAAHAALAEAVKRTPAR